MRKLLNSLKAAVLAAVILALAILVRPTYALLTEIRLTVVEARRATKSIADYAQVQTEQLRSPRNVKALELGIAAAATAQVSFQEINRHILPKASKVLDSLDQSAQSLNALIITTDHEINAHLLPTATADLEETGKRLKEFEQTADSVNSSLLEIRNLLANGDLNSTVRSLAASSHNVELATDQLRLASESVPETARSIESIAKTSARWRKWILGSQILSTLSRVFY